MHAAPAPPSPGLPPPAGPPAGWYPDPSGHGVRYFDGFGWAPVPALAARPTGAAPAADRGPHPTLPLSAAVGAIVVLALSLVVQQVVARLISGRGWPVLLTAAIGMVLAYGPSLWWCRRVMRAVGGGVGQIGLRFRWIDAGWGPLTWIGSYIAELIVVLVAIRLLGVPFESNVDTTSDDITAPYVIALIATAVIAAPIVEELIFRGVVLRGLIGRLGTVAAVAVQGVLFGFAHLDPVDRGWGNIGLILGLSVVGCGLGLTAVLTRRIGAPIIAHACLNGFVLVIVLSGVADDVDRDLGRIAAVVAGALGRVA